MAKVPKKVADRLAKQLPIFQKILTTAKDKDVGESDTVMIIRDMLSNLFGFDQWTEITTEFSIRGTYCDLAVKLDEKVKYLIEVKAIGMTLKDNHLRQAVNYGANHGIPWIVLTNGILWEIHNIRFEKPISHDLTCAMNILEMNPRKSDDIEHLYLLCREGLTRDAIEEFDKRARYVNRFMVAALLQSDPVLKLVRRQLRSLSPGAKVTIDELKSLLPDVLKRDVTEGDSAQDAQRRARRSASKARKKSLQKKEPDAELSGHAADAAQHVKLSTDADQTEAAT